MGDRVSLWIAAGLTSIVVGCDRSEAPPLAKGRLASESVANQGPVPGARELPVDDQRRKDDWFDDVTDKTGVRFSYRNGREGNRFYIMESLGGGLALFDFDRDGELDLFCTGGGTIAPESVPGGASADGSAHATPTPPAIAGLPAALFRSEGDWRFADSTQAAGFEIAADYSFGCAVSDFNADGWPDVTVCCYGRSRLYRNLGDGTFAEAADAAQLPAIGMGTTATWADLDRDGLPDLFLARYIDWRPEIDVTCRSTGGERDICGPTAYPGTSSLFFHNRGDGSFDDWSGRLGLKHDGRALGVLAADLNADGWVDYYVCNDEAPNHLYLGGSDLPLVESGEIAGVAFNEYGVEEGSMGLDAGDVDGDGRPDLFVTNFENEDNALYRNLGDGMFRHASVAFGLAGASRLQVGFGTLMLDFDHDGWLDLVILNGHALYHDHDSPFRQEPQLFRNRDGQRFENVSPSGGVYFRQPHAGRGIAAGDIDHDGAVDLVVGHLNEPVQILRHSRSPANFLGVRLRATRGDPEAIGARVDYAPPGGRVLHRDVVRGAGYFSQSDTQLLFPADPETARVDIRVQWPGRGLELFRDVTTGCSQTLVEGRGTPL